jgi:hypothetical protein
MINKLVVQWEENKHKLQDYFKETNQEEYDTYTKIIRIVFELCFTKEWDLDKMTVIDNGDYQGTEIFIIPRDTYQPSVHDYIVTDTYYGSCSGCDTLLSISEYEVEKPNEDQVMEYMTLALHLIQRLHYLSCEDAN